MIPVAQRHAWGVARGIWPASALLLLTLHGPAVAGSAGDAPGVGLAGVPLWLSGPALTGAIAGGELSGGAVPGVQVWPQLASAADLRVGARPASGHARAFLAALMSGVIPGAGQLHNGSVLRGIGYLALEVGGWVAYTTFDKGSEEKEDELALAATEYWSYERYHARAPDPDSCVAYECPCGAWSEGRDAEIVGVIESGDRGALLEYLTRDAYACGWDGSLSRQMYASLWGDREHLLDARGWLGRVIFLNHLVSAVDAFIEARSLKLNIGADTHVKFNVRGLPREVRPEIRVTSHFN